ncbi:MAG TPA: ribokinase [Tepidisphaeraceae bacterium]|jgi:ribokinase|nr:ribokinase [Tepidisphaeraceae bacterium]
MNAKPIVTVVGSFCVDILIRADRLPVWGETLIGRDFYLGPGGKGGNQAAGVARMGATTHFITAVGEDRFAQLAFDLARAEGIALDGICVMPGATTSVGFGLLDPAGRSACITDLAALARMDAALVDRFEAQIAASDVVLTMLENPLEAAARAMHLGRKHKKLTILNPAPAVALSDEILADCDIVTPNESELRVLLGLSPDSGGDDIDLARRLRLRGIKTLIVTRGGRGALVLSDQGEAQIPGVKVDVVDTTGAGDAFNAALAVALAEKIPLKRAIELANCAGALACTKLGSIPAMGNRAAVETLWKNYFK